MDSTNLCNALRMKFEGGFENNIPLEVFSAKIQDMILALARQENYSIEYMMAFLLVAVSTAIGNAVNIRICGGWISKPALYDIGRLSQNGQNSIFGFRIPFHPKA